MLAKKASEKPSLPHPPTRESMPMTQHHTLTRFLVRPQLLTRP
jgi:hypothetical protein